MFDPISIFYFAWILNAGLPNGRLNVEEIIQLKENTVIVEQINSEIKLRNGL